MATGGVTPETHDLSESGVVLLASRDSQSESGLSTTASDSQSDTSEHSHSKPRPLLFFPPPPDTPPPPNLSPDPHVQRVGSPCGSEVVDSSTQVHVSARDSLSSGKLTARTTRTRRRRQAGPTFRTLAHLVIMPGLTCCV